MQQNISGNKKKELGWNYDKEEYNWGYDLVEIELLCIRRTVQTVQNSTKKGSEGWTGKAPLLREDIEPWCENMAKNANTMLNKTWRGIEEHWNSR
jgi:hypothetical protein